MRSTIAYCSAMLLILLLAGSPALSGETVEIDFSNVPFPDGLNLTTQYQSRGILFSNASADLAPGILCPPLGNQENRVQGGELLNLYRLDFVTEAPVRSVRATFTDRNSFRQIHILYGLDSAGRIVATSQADDLGRTGVELFLFSTSGLASIVACELPLGAQVLDHLVYETADGASCVPGNDRLCLGRGRFKVTTEWRTALGAMGTGSALQLTDDTGYFWFFDPANVEVVIKVLDACLLNQRFWVFAGGLTDVEVVVTVEDTLTGIRRVYENRVGTPFQPLQDTDAFATCE